MEIQEQGCCSMEISEDSPFERAAHCNEIKEINAYIQTVTERYEIQGD
jgi:hypothetical protein